MIALKNIYKSFGTQAVLTNLSFEVPRGSSTALLGLSGSGKTTVLKLICAIYGPDQGEIYLDSDKIKPESLKKIRKKLGYVIQDGGLFPHLTGFDNLNIVAKEQGLTDTQIQTRTEELCEMTKIQINLLKLYPRQLSGGERQRIGIMRALFLDPPILLLDEPLGSLDPITKSELQLELKELITKLKKTVLLVTHDLFEADLLSDQILLLNKGVIVQKGTMKDLVESPINDFVKKFVSSQI